MKYVITQSFDKSSPLVLFADNIARAKALVKWRVDRGIGKGVNCCNIEDQRIIFDINGDGKILVDWVE